MKGKEYNPARVMELYSEFTKIQKIYLFLLKSLQRMDLQIISLTYLKKLNLIIQLLLFHQTRNVELNLEGDLAEFGYLSTSIKISNHNNYVEY